MKYWVLLEPEKLSAVREKRNHVVGEITKHLTEISLLRNRNPFSLSGKVIFTSNHVFESIAYIPIVEQFSRFVKWQN